MRDEDIKKILVVDNGNGYLEELGKFFSRCYVTIKSREQFVPALVSMSDVVVISGSFDLPIIGNEDAYAKEIDFIQKATVPVLGVCLGYELIAHAFGARLELIEHQEKGAVSISTSSDSELFEGIKDLSVYGNRRWMVQTLPPELQGIASSSQGFEIIKHRTKLIYGFQFHPGMFVHESSGNKLFSRTIDFLKRSA